MRIVAIGSFMSLVVAWGATSASGQAPSSSPPSFGGQPVAHWVQQLTSEDKETRRRAAYAIGQIGRAAAKEAGPKLVALLDDQEPEVVWYAADALGRMGEAARGAVKPLGAVLVDPSNREYPDIRINAARALGRIGPAARETVPALQAAMQRGEPAYQVEAALALWKISGAAEAVPALAKSVQGADAAVAYSACRALAEIGRDARGAEPALVAALGNKDADVRRAAAQALGPFGAEAVPFILQGVRNADLEAVLIAFGYVADQLRENVLYAPHQSAERARTDAQTLLKLPALSKLLSDPRAPLRQRAAGVLAKLGPLAVPKVLEALADENPVIRETAIECLADLERYLPSGARRTPAVEEVKLDAVPALVKGLQHADGQVRSATLRIFEALDIGPAGRVALPHLRDQLRDDNVRNRRAAIRCIERIQGGAEPATSS